MKKVPFIWLFVIVVITIPAILPYFHQGYFPTHDGEWAVVRLADMYRTVRDLQIPARMSGYLNAGYGYPLFNFAYPFPYYFGLIPLFAGLGFVGSLKFLFAISVPLSAIAMYFLSRKLWNNDLAGITSAVLYTYFPYRFVDLYVRGSIGESLSFILFPLILWSVLRIAEKPTSIVRILIGGTAFGILIGTHNIMTVLFAPLLLVVIAFQFITTKKFKGGLIRSYGFMLLFGLALSFFFWFPALCEKQFIKLSQTPIAERSLYFVTVEQLLRPSWGYEPPTEKGGFSYQIGIPHIVIAIITTAAVIYLFVKKRNNTSGFPIHWFIVLFGFNVLLMFKASSLFWEHVPLFSEINYPWTILSQLGILIALFGGYLGMLGKWFRRGVFSIAIIAVILHLPYAKPSHYVDRGDDFYVTNSATTTSSDELMPLWVKEKPLAFPKYTIETLSERNKAVNASDTNGIFGAVFLESEDIVRINRIYYPGWKVYVDNKEVPVSYDNQHGVMDITLPQGSYTISAQFTETPYRLLSNGVSVLAVFFGTLLIVSGKLRNTIEHSLLHYS